ncbi:hypothetical protein BDN72DRAFT_880851 [Pluteus cervinus]|uniref:Uncharacterized protein n=1 Tax=Pluteus cervinus TaxID=181527 RepID=A0ACD3AIG0_9AGAR|nr:hypothetical protein BDN72DRAFT_880851 [Pluteus cervinus]
MDDGLDYNAQVVPEPFPHDLRPSSARSHRSRTPAIPDFPDPSSQSPMTSQYLQVPSHFPSNSGPTSSRGSNHHRSHSAPGQTSPSKSHRPRSSSRSPSQSSSIASFQTAVELGTPEGTPATAANACLRTLSNDGRIDGRARREYGGSASGDINLAGSSSRGRKGEPLPTTAPPSPLTEVSIPSNRSSPHTDSRKYLEAPSSALWTSANVDTPEQLELFLATEPKRRLRTTSQLERTRKSSQGKSTKDLRGYPSLSQQSTGRSEDMVEYVRVRSSSLSVPNASSAWSTTDEDIVTSIVSFALGCNDAVDKLSKGVRIWKSCFMQKGGTMQLEAQISLLSMLEHELNELSMHLLGVDGQLRASVPPEQGWVEDFCSRMSQLPVIMVNCMSEVPEIPAEVTITSLANATRAYSRHSEKIVRLRKQIEWSLNKLNVRRVRGAAKGPILFHPKDESPGR